MSPAAGSFTPAGLLCRRVFYAARSQQPVARLQTPGLLCRRVFYAARSPQPDARSLTPDAGSFTPPAGLGLTLINC